MTQKDIRFLRVTHLRGPNIWTYRPVIEAWLDIGGFEQAPSHTLTGFNERLIACLPGLRAHRCGVGEPGGFLLRLETGTWIGHVLEHVVLELQTLIGLRTGFGKTRQTSEGSGIYKMAFRTRHEQIGRRALEIGRRLVLAMVEDQSFDVDAEVQALREMADDLMLGPSTECIVSAATARRIPTIRLAENNLVQLGYGAHQRRIWTAETDRTSAIAQGIAGDKDLTKRLLASCGVPVPDGRVVESASDAWEAAEDFGLPVAVKPLDGNHGRGVSLDLHGQADIEAAYELAARHGSDVIVEQFIRGLEHRLLVVGSQVVAVARGEEAWIEGDGTSSIIELVDRQLNSDPRRGYGEDFPLNPVHPSTNSATRLELARQGLQPESTPLAGQRILVQRNGNVAHDCTDTIHPAVAALAVLAARVVGLDIAGVDLVAEDISRPLEEQGGAIVEINAGPGLLPHLRPAAGSPRPVGEAIAEHLFPMGQDGRIPVVGIAGRHCSTEIARMVACLLRLSGHHVGLACADGLFLDRRQVSGDNAINFRAGQRLLTNRSVTAAVFETHPEAILNEGLPYDRCAVAVVTDVSGGERLDAFYIHTDDQLTEVLRTQIDVVLSDGVAVLNAADTRVMKMASLCDGEVLLYAESEMLPAIVAHRARGGRAVFARAGRVYRTVGPEATLLEELGTLPEVGGCANGNANILATVGAGWALGLAADLIAAGIETFEAEQGAAASGVPVLRTREH